MTLSQFLQQPISSKSHIEQRGASLIEKDKLKNTFIEMIQSHYIMRAESNFPDADKQVEAKSKMDDPKPNAKNKPNSKSKKKQVEVTVNTTEITNLDQRFTLPTSLIGEKRKYSEDELEDNVSSTVISDDMEIFLTSTTTTVSTQSVAKKSRKSSKEKEKPKASSSSSTSTQASSSKSMATPMQVETTTQSDGVAIDNDVYWRVNYEQFHIFYRNEAIVAFVNEKINTNAALIVKTMLRLSERYDKQSTRTSAISVDRLSRALPKNNEFVEKDDTVNQAEIVKYLIAMAKDVSEMVIKVGESDGGSYSVNIENVVHILKQKTIESIIQEKFDLFTCRIFRILLYKKQLEQKNISELAMLPLKEVRERLYKMLAQNYVQLQEVPKSNDHAPQRTFYLWNVNLLEVKNLLLSEIYKTIINIQLRLRFEFDTSKDVIAKPPSTLTDQEKQQVARLQRVADRLEASILHLDQSLMLLCDY